VTGDVGTLSAFVSMSGEIFVPHGAKVDGSAVEDDFVLLPGAGGRSDYCERHLLKRKNQLGDLAR
jgi:hypothetical protein